MQIYWFDANSQLEGSLDLERVLSALDDCPEPIRSDFIVSLMWKIHSRLERAKVRLERAAKQLQELEQLERIRSDDFRVQRLLENISRDREIVLEYREALTWLQGRDPHSGRLFCQALNSSVAHEVSRNTIKHLREEILSII